MRKLKKEIMLKLKLKIYQTKTDKKRRMYEKKLLLLQRRFAKSFN